jgi:anaerobic ribonucleoside-triphosphate reductase
MNVKKKQKELILQNELESSAYMVRKSHALTEQDNEKARIMKIAQAGESNRLLLENIELLEKRRLEREENHKMDRKYVQELDDKFQREEDRRKQEVARKAASNSTDKGAFIMAKVCMYMYECVYVYVCMYVNACMHMHVYVCLHVMSDPVCVLCIHIHTYIHIHVHIYNVYNDMTCLSICLTSLTPPSPLCL